MIISVVIPCRNEKDQIEACIRTIYESDLKEGVGVEVIVVDGLSDDGTIDIINQLKTEFSSLLIVENQAKVTPVAFNLGIQNAKGEYVQIIGARQLISKNYLQGALDTLLGDSDIWCVGGAVENVYQTPESELIGKAMASSFGVGAGNFRIMKESAFTDTVGTPMYPSKVFKEIGMFDEALVRNQDDELNYRVTKAGGKIFLNAEILIKYFVRGKKSQLKRQYYQYGYWKVFVNKKHNTITTIRQLFPLFMVIGLLFGVLIALVVPVFSVLVVLGLTAYLGIGLFFALRISKKSEEVVEILYIYAILHFSYGLGYFKGIIDFLILNKKPSTKNARLSRG